MPSNRSNRLAIKKDESTFLYVFVEKDSEFLDGTSLATSWEISRVEGSRKPISRVDDAILEAITKLKEPRGSSRVSIAQYIADHYSAPSDIEKSLAANFKALTENGRLIKVKNQYRITPKSVSFSLGKELLPLEAQKNEFVLLTKAMIDAELEKMKSMSPEDAVKAAAKAVAEAEAAIAEAEAAAREAEEAETEAEAARCVADAAQRALNFQTLHI